MCRVRVHGERGRGDVIPNPMRLKDDGCYHLIIDEDDNIQTHLIREFYKEEVEKTFEFLKRLRRLLDYD